MNRFTIYCTEEQTRKAFELGAPIKANKDYSNGNLSETLCIYGDTINKDKWGIGECTILHIPTAEQMLGWLEEQNNIREIRVYRFYSFTDKEVKWTFDIRGEESDVIEVASRKEATLAAIDAALEYLIKSKEK